MKNLIDNSAMTRLQTIVCIAVLAASIAVAVYIAVNQNSADKCEKSIIPSSIVEKSNQFVISKVGQDFFNKYINIDYNRSRYYLRDEFIIKNPEAGADFLQRSYYLMVYSFKMPEKPFVDELMEFAVDTEGNVILEREVMGIPDCINNPTECNFPIDEAEAMQIARNAGLEDGITDWETSFHWYAGGLKTYVWTVQNTLSTTPSGQNYSASGKGVVIDANSGEIKQTYQWQTNA